MECSAEGSDVVLGFGLGAPEQISLSSNAAVCLLHSGVLSDLRRDNGERMHTRNSTDPSCTQICGFCCAVTFIIGNTCNILIL